jgi:uncharacterized protein (DUF58 family)
MRGVVMQQRERWRLFPTRSGLIGLVILVAMFIASMNYGNTLAYVLCFFILSVMTVSSVYTQYNLSGLQIKSVQAQPVFAGGNVLFRIDIRNGSSIERVAVFMASPDCHNPGDYVGPFSFPPHMITSIDFSMPAPRRGLHTLSSITMETVYPLGLFRKWGLIPVNQEYLVFPRPAGLRSWPPPLTMWFENVEGFHFSGGDDFTGLRSYRPGESQHHIDWKAYARGRPLSIKEFSGGGSFQQWFEWSVLSQMSTEDRLSQLTRWVLEADQHGKEFGLRLPGMEIEPDSSSLHTLRCLKELAIFDDKR